MTNSPHVPHNAISLTRISDARPDLVTGEKTPEGVDDQVRNHKQWGKDHGWKITHYERSLRTAYSRKLVKRHENGIEEWRVWRPDLQTCLGMLWRREHDGLLVTDLDRYARDPYDLEDLITLVEQARKRGWPLRVASLTGSLRLDTDADMAMARVQMAMARKSSQDTARRVSDARTRLALAKKHGGGPRPYGFGLPLLDGRGRPVLDPSTRRPILDYTALVPEEAAVIAQASKEAIAGLSMRAIARDLNERGVPTTTGNGPWRPETLREILIRPRNAGKIVNKGEIVGDWPGEPIVPEETWRAVHAKLTDPERLTNTSGPDPKWLGSGIYRCGKPGCEFPLYVQTFNAKGWKRPKYCHRARAVGTGHAARLVEIVDEYVETVLLERLLRPDAVDLLAPPPSSSGVDIGALNARRAELRGTRSDLADARRLGIITQADLLKQGRSIADELATIEAALAEAEPNTGASLLRPLVEAANYAEALGVWRGMTVGAQRAVLQRTLAITIIPMGRRGPRGPRAESIIIEPITPY